MDGGGVTVEELDRALLELLEDCSEPAGVTVTEAEAEKAACARLKCLRARSKLPSTSISAAPEDVYRYVALVRRLQERRGVGQAGRAQPHRDEEARG